MNLDVVELTKDLVAIQSVSRWSNRAVCDYLEPLLKQCEFEVERLMYVDPNGEEKFSLVAKKGAGSGGLSGVIGLNRAEGDHRVCTLVQGFTDQIF